VSDANELNQALHAANTNNGNYEILLEDGTYQLNQNLLYVSPNMANLTIRSKSNNADQVIIRGTGMKGNVTHIFNVAAKHFTAADLTIGWVANHAVQIHSENDADSCLIQNVKFFDIGEQMIKGSGSDNGMFSDDCTIQCCHFEFTDGVASQYYTGGIDGHKTRNWMVFNNTFVDIRSPDHQLAEHAIHFWNGCIGTVVRNNTIINCDRGIGFGLGQKGHYGGAIINNMVHTSRDVGIGLESSPETEVYNNTVVTDNYFNSIEYRFDVTQNVHIANNLVDKSITSRNGGEGTVESNFTFSDPTIFVDHSGHDYHLSGPVSGITNAGIILQEVKDDFDCETRNLNTAIDIGADDLETTSTYITSPSVLDLEISPNPTSGLVTINPHILLKEVCISDGLRNLRVTVDQNGLLDISVLPSGLYMIIGKSGQNIYSAKIVLL
jgi:hypothetical protein